MSEAAQARFAGYLATIGRGPGRGRPLKREEAADAFGLILDEIASPMQVGAFLLVLRYRRETAEELAGFADAVHARFGSIPANVVDLDWPTYANGRTRTHPYFVEAAADLARKKGVRILIHGENDPCGGDIGAEDKARALGLPIVEGLGDAAAAIAAEGVAFLPLRHFAPMLATMMDLKPTLGLRTPANALCRMLNPLCAPRAFVGVFHPDYIPLQVDGAQIRGHRAFVVKGAGGEAEWSGLKKLKLVSTQGEELIAPMDGGSIAATTHVVTRLMAAD